MPRSIARATAAVVIGSAALLPALALSAPASAAAPDSQTVRALAPVPAAPVLAADCCQAGINGLPGRFTVGADPRQFTVSFKNTSQQQIGSLSVTFTFSGGNLDADRITMRRQASNGSWQGLDVGRHNGTIAATDSRFRFGQPLTPGASVTLNYQLGFDDKAAPTQVQLGVTVNGRTGNRVFGGGHSTELAATGASFSVVAVAPPAPKPTPKPTLTPTPTPTPDETASAPASAAAIDTGPGGPPITPASGSGSSGSSSWVWVAYVIGALLLLGGIAAIGTLLWRRGPDKTETDWDDDGTALQPGGGTAVYPVATTYPTQPLPAPYSPAIPHQSGPPQSGPPQFGPPQSGPPQSGPAHSGPPRPASGRHSADPTRQLPR